MSLARDSLLRRLGQWEGEKLSGAVHVDDISTAELPLVGEFAQEGLLRVYGPSVQFAHDLMGDWARYRILKFAGPGAPAKIKAHAHVPRWGRAIRLYAQSLAEHGKDLKTGKRLRSHSRAKTRSQNSRLIFFSTDCCSRQMRSHCLSRCGLILRRTMV